MHLCLEIFIIFFIITVGHAMAQAISLQPLTLEAQVWSQASPHDICGG
jgi:hypothetical protein